MTIQPSSADTAQAIAHELFAHECFAFIGEGGSHSHRCQQAGKRLQEWRNTTAMRESADRVHDALYGFDAPAQGAASCGEPDWYRWRYMTANNGWSKWIALNVDEVPAVKDLQAINLEVGKVELQPLYAAPQPTSIAYAPIGTSPVAVELMQRIWDNLYHDRDEFGTYQQTLNEVVDWLAALDAIPSVEASPLPSTDRGGGK